MTISGIADEAGKDIGTQIRAHRELGWGAMELRLVDGKNVAGELADDAFDRVCDALEAADMKVTGFASRIANWSRHIRDDFAADVEDLRSSIPRMQRLKVPYIRIMSWKGDGVPEDEWRRSAVERLRELAKMAEDGGIFLAHENCTGWGGLSARHMVELKGAVDSPNFLLLYDIGNAVTHGNEAEAFFQGIRGNFSYVHVKDAKKPAKAGEEATPVYCGDGDANLVSILKRIIVEDGYDGVVAIEPHVASMVHAGASANKSPEEMYSSYVEYGRRLEKILGELRTASG